MKGQHAAPDLCHMLVLFRHKVANLCCFVSIFVEHDFNNFLTNQNMDCIYERGPTQQRLN